MNDFNKRLLHWFKHHKRSLPWRQTNDPYLIWLSEIILQQTRVDQGLPYYLRFVERFPSVTQLADASRDEVFKLWQGLGYYRRADNLMKTAKQIAGHYNGQFPKDFQKLKTLPGVGDYTAAAIASIAFGEKVPVVDGNVYRVISRLFGVKEVVQTAKTRKIFAAKMLDLMGDSHPGVFNEAVMEFGAIQCTPSSPDCSSCIFKDSCYAYQNDRIADFPVVKPSVKKKKRFIFYVVFHSDNEIILRSRGGNDLWKGLYDFPSLEYDSKPLLSELTQDLGEMMESGLSVHEKTEILPGTLNHTLTHLQIEAGFISVYFKNNDLSAFVLPGQKLIKLPCRELKNFPVSKLIDRFLMKRLLPCLQKESPEL